MGFFDDIFGAFTNQQSAPQQTIIPTDQLMAQSYGLLNGTIAPGLVDFNKAIAPGLTDVQLGVTNQIDPSILANYRGANKSILDQLNLGSNLPADVQQQVIQNALQSASTSGFGVSPGGRGLVAKDLGLTSLDLLNQRQQAALQAGTTGLGISNRIYDPQYYTGLGANLAGGIGEDIRSVQAAKDNYANLTADIKAKNFSNLLNTGGRILGGIIGGVATGGAGTMTGMQIGGNIFGSGGVAGYGNQSQSQGGGNPFGSLLNLFGGGGYSAGPGAQYLGPNGLETSMMASPVFG